MLSIAEYLGRNENEVMQYGASVGCELGLLPNTAKQIGITQLINGLSITFLKHNTATIPRINVTMTTKAIASLRNFEEDVKNIFGTETEKVRKTKTLELLEARFGRNMTILPNIVTPDVQMVDRELRIACIKLPGSDNAKAVIRMTKQKMLEDTTEEATKLKEEAVLTSIRRSLDRELTINKTGVYFYPENMSHLLENPQHEFFIFVSTPMKVIFVLTNQVSARLDNFVTQLLKNMQKQCLKIAEPKENHYRTPSLDVNLFPVNTPNGQIMIPDGETIEQIWNFLKEKYKENPMFKYMQEKQEEELKAIIWEERNKIYAAHNASIDLLYEIPELDTKDMTEFKNKAKMPGSTAYEKEKARDACSNYIQPIIAIIKRIAMLTELSETLQVREKERIAKSVQDIKERITNMESELRVLYINEKTEMMKQTDIELIGMSYNSAAERMVKSLIEKDTLQYVTLQNNILYLAFDIELTDYDEEKVKQYSESALRNLWNETEDRRLITKEIFRDKNYRIQMWDGMKINISTGEINSWSPSDKDCPSKLTNIANQHHARFNCFGSYKQQFVDICRKQKDISQLIMVAYSAACGLNITDSTVCRETMDVLKNNPGKKWYKDKAGNRVNLYEIKKAAQQGRTTADPEPEQVTEPNTERAFRLNDIEPMPVPTPAATNTEIDDIF